MPTVYTENLFGCSRADTNSAIPICFLGSRSIAAFCGFQAIFVWTFTYFIYSSLGKNKESDEPTVHMEGSRCRSVEVCSVEGSI